MAGGTVTVREAIYGCPRAANKPVYRQFGWGERGADKVA